MSAGAAIAARIDRATIERIVLGANTAPSAENCQPWRFRWDGETLSVLHDDERARHALNPGNLMSKLTLGCLVEALSIAASAERLRAEIEITRADVASGASSSAPWAKVRFPTSEALPDPLARVLPLRATDRRMYRGGALSEPVFAEIRDDARGETLCRVHVIDRASDELTDLMVKADQFVWRDARVYHDMVRWLRFTPEEAARTRDGAHYRTAGAPLPERLPGAELARSGLAQKLFGRLGGHVVMGELVRRQLRSSSALLAFTVRAPGEDELVATGRLAMRAWLRLNAAGWGVQPMSLQSLPVYRAVFGELPRDLPRDLGGLFRRGRAMCARAFGHGDDEVMLWMFRAGHVTALPPDLRTLRLPVEKILSVTA